MVLEAETERSSAFATFGGFVGGDNSGAVPTAAAGRGGGGGRGMGGVAGFAALSLEGSDSDA